MTDTTHAGASDPTDAVEPSPGLTCILESNGFQKSPALRKLLVYLWKYREETLSEYAIATDALGRSPLFDAKFDSTVRVQISRLRQRLDRFYQKEGLHVTERLVIPLGSYKVRMEAAPVAESPAGAPGVETPDARYRKYKRIGITLACLCAVLLIACAALTVALLRAHQAFRQAAPQPVAQFWKTFSATIVPPGSYCPLRYFLPFRRPVNMAPSCCAIPW